MLSTCPAKRKSKAVTVAGFPNHVRFARFSGDKEPEETSRARQIATDEVKVEYENSLAHIVFFYLPAQLPLLFLRLQCELAG